jgi:hypothetical protein
LGKTIDEQAKADLEKGVYDEKYYNDLRIKYNQDYFNAMTALEKLELEETEKFNLEHNVILQDRVQSIIDNQNEAIDATKTGEEKRLSILEHSRERELMLFERANRDGVLNEEEKQLAIQAINDKFDAKRMETLKSGIQGILDNQAETQSIILQGEERRLFLIKTAREKELDEFEKANKNGIMNEEEYQLGLQSIRDKYIAKEKEPVKEKLHSISELMKANDRLLKAYEEGEIAVNAYNLGLKETSTAGERAAILAAASDQKMMDKAAKRYEAQKNYAENIISLEQELAIAAAKQRGDKEAEYEARAAILMRDNKLSREQAEEILDLEDKITQAREKNKGFETASAMYSRMMNAALEPGRQAGSMKEERDRDSSGSSGSGKSTTTKEIEKSNKTLTDIYDLMQEIKRGLPLLGAAS